MTEVPIRGRNGQKSNHIALLQYVADQLRCYSDEIKADDDVLTTFAELLDGLAIELNTIQPYIKSPNYKLVSFHE
jgi:hypothetical protein